MYHQRLRQKYGAGLVSAENEVRQNPYRLAEPISSFPFPYDRIALSQGIEPTNLERQERMYVLSAGTTKDILIYRKMNLLNLGLS